jgi:hypothetical protein
MYKLKDREEKLLDVMVIMKWPNHRQYLRQIQEELSLP